MIRKIVNISTYKRPSPTGTTRDMADMELLWSGIMSEEAASKYMCKEVNGNPLDV